LKERDDLPSYRDINKEEDEDEDDTVALEEEMTGFSTREEEVRKRTTDIERH
jgi:hypothetical protein